MMFHKKRSSVNRMHDSITVEKITILRALTTSGFLVSGGLAFFTNF